MATIAETADRSQMYIDNLATNIDRVLNSSEIEGKLTQLGRDQMLASVGNDGKPLVHTGTGSKYLSKAYAKKQNKKTPNIKLSGDYQKAMVTESHYGKKQYYQKSNDFKLIYLPDMYENLHGLNQNSVPLAHAITTPAIAEDYKQKVL